MTNEASSIVRRAIEILREEGMIIFARKSLTYMKQKIKIFILPYALLKIKNFNQDLDKLVDFTFNGLIAELIKPSQVRDEILELLRILDKKKPKIVLEIGTANGGTLFLFSRIASEDATIISVDLPGGQFGGGYPKWKIPLYKAFRLPKQKLHLIRGDSHSKETLEKTKNVLNSRKADFLFIDGDHTYEGVRRDFEMYSSLVEEEGIIAFHDIVIGPKENVGGVPKFWREEKDNYACKEIVKDWKQGGYGIGVLEVRK